MLVPAVAVLGAEQTVAETLDRLALYHDQARVVVRRAVGPEMRWYGFRVGQVRAALEGAAGEASLEESLALEAPLDVWEEIGRRPGQGFAGLVLAANRVVGIAEPGGGAEEPEEPPEAEEEDDYEAVDRAFLGLGRQRPVGEPEPVTVYYATDRNSTGKRVPDEFYGGQRGELSFGRLVVTIPPGHQEGEIERPRVGQEDPYWHVVVQLPSPLGRQEFVGEVRAELAETAERTALLFVHGYNVTFASAARRTAQMAFDLGFRGRGVPMFYSWPSQGDARRYGADETNARWTLEHFEEFLRLAMTELGVETLHVIAHSMGNRPLIEALRVFDVEALPAGSAALDQVVFAAPDFDGDTFRNLAARLARKAQRCTLYASSQDRALQLSRRYRSNLSRAGESGPDLVVVPGIDTIDATAVRTSFLGHSYYGERTVLDDIERLISRDNPGPDERERLSRRDHGGLGYWELQPAGHQP